MSEPYLPSNGTEGEWFMEKWCANCLNDCYPNMDGDERAERRELGSLGLHAWANIDSEQECEILANALAGEQPDEWIRDERGARCTAFRDDPDSPAFDPSAAIGLLV